MNDQRQAIDRWHDQVLGVVLLAACGDALGAPFEGMPAPDRAALGQWETRPDPLLWTDDTALLVVTAEHLLATGGRIDEDGLAHAYAREWQADPERGYGSGPPLVFGDLLAGGDWRRTAAELFDGEGSYGNGGAMRVAPLALLPGLELADIAALARQVASITHQHPLGMEGAAIQAVAVALAARSDPRRPLDVAQFIRSLVKQLSLNEYRFALRDAHTLVRSGCQPRDVAAALGNATSAGASVPAALTSFLRFPDDPVTALRFAISIGGDTDTIAAMTGAMAGARCGTRALPGAWHSRLEQAERLHAAAYGLAGLGRRTWAGGPASAGPGTPY